MGRYKWKNIENHDGYITSSNGEIASYRQTNSKKRYETPHILKHNVITTHCGKKYARVRIDGKTYYVHRLVAIHFIENQFKKPQVNHIDNDSLNNNYRNLEWVDNSENQIHRFKLNGRYNNLSRYVYKNRNTYKVEKKGIINKCFKTYEEAKEFASKFY